MKCSDFIAFYLQKRGLTHVFELVGGMITHLIDSISNNTSIKIVSCHHEQGAGFAAEGYARITGLPGIALATSGPGATNLLTSIGSCFFDSVPAVFITGQVNTFELKGTKKIRQLGFQETDIASMAQPVCKLVIELKSSEDLPAALDKAFKCSLSGRQGPCLIDIPMNIQSEHIDDNIANSYLSNISPEIPYHPLNLKVSSDLSLSDFFSSLIESVRQANRPLLLMGGGCSAPINREQARQFAEILNIPVVHSLMGIDILPTNHPLKVGFIGSYGNRWANKLLGNADLLVVLGSRLDIRQTGSNVESFALGKDIWQIDIDSAELGVRVRPHRSVSCSIIDAARSLLSISSSPISLNALSTWRQQVLSLKSQFPASLEYSSECDDINPINILQWLSSSQQSSCIYVTDVGQHQMWAAQCIDFGNDDRFLTSGGMGAMGFGLPAAIGASMAHSSVTTYLITGDGSFQLNIQELQTLYRNNLNIKIILFNNQCHGMVRQFQETYFDGNLQSTVQGYSTPDFLALAQAYKIPSRSIHSQEDLSDVWLWLSSIKGPALLEAPLSVRSKVYPKLAYGRDFGEMEPDVSPVAMEST